MLWVFLPRETPQACVPLIVTSASLSKMISCGELDATLAHHSTSRFGGGIHTPHSQFHMVKRHRAGASEPVLCPRKRRWVGLPLSQAAGAGTPVGCTYVPLPPVPSGRPQRPSAPYPPPPFPRRVACFCFLHSTFRRISKNTRENTGKKRQLRSGALIDTHTPDCSYLSCIGVVREKHSNITPWCSPGASARGACAAASARSR